MFEIKTGKISTPYLIMLYGTPKIGKTTLASKASKPLILDCENGSNEIDCARVTIRNQTELFKAMNWASGLDEYETVVIDSATRIDQLFTAEILKTHNKKSLAGFAYGAGYEFLKDEWSRFLRGCDLLKASGKNVILVAHNRIKPYVDPMHETYDRYEPEVDKKSLVMLISAMDAVLFYRYRVHVKESDDEKRNLAVGGNSRELYTAERPSFIAGNRYDLDPCIIDPDHTFFTRIGK